jgi:cystathionine beta-lyase
MKYDFTKLTNRRNTNSYKWDVKEDVLPMWVADMDFECAPEIIEAIQSKVSKGILGYTYVPNEWANAYQSWWERRHHYTLQKEYLIFAIGVVPIISSTVRKFTAKGDKVVIQSPVYNIFYNSILNNGCEVLENTLVYNNNAYEMDFEDLEIKLSDPLTKLMILCNPHNPVGKIWDRETLNRVGELCFKHNVLVLSDEIHCDITKPNTNYIPFASVSEVCEQNSITCIAPTKAFNLAGIHSAAAYVVNPEIYQKLNRALNTDEVAEPNAIGIEATISAFNQGEVWLEELRNVVFSHRRIAKKFIEEQISDLKLIDADATYLLWIDCSKLTENTEILCEILEEEVGLKIVSGKEYGDGGKAFIRMNIACPINRLMDGLERLSKGIKLYKDVLKVEESI